MIKSWYIHVREETMAPARMISFMEQHISSCEVCRQDPDLKEEVTKITVIILPESKIPKAVRQQEGDGFDDDLEVVGEDIVEGEGDGDLDEEVDEISVVELNEDDPAVEDEV